MLTTILQRLDHERRHLAIDVHILESLPHITRVRAADHSHHNIAWSSLTTENADAIISSEIAHHRQLNVPFEWKLYAHDTPPDLLTRLQNQGLQIGPREAVMIYDLATPPAWSATASRAQRADTLAQVDTYRNVAEEIFKKNYDFTATELAQAIQSRSTQHRGYIAYAENKPVIARLYTHPKSHFAGLYGGATLPAHRHNGHYRALIATRAKDALAANAKYLLVDALPTSRPILAQPSHFGLSNRI